MSRHLATALALTIPLLAALPASAQETTLLCRFSKFTVTESDGRPGLLKTAREVTLAIPRSILVSVDADHAMVASHQQNMQLDPVSFSDGQVTARIQHATDKTWLFGEETDGAPILLVDLANHIGSVMAQLKSTGPSKLALSAGLCRPFRMQTPDPEPQIQASAALAPNAN